MTGAAGKSRRLKPIWAKLTLWRRLPGFHPSIRKTALATALRSGDIFARHADSAAAPAGSVHRDGMATTAHPFWADAFEGRTTSFAACLFPRVRITCIDPWAEHGEMSDLSLA